MLIENYKLEEYLVKNDGKAIKSFRLYLNGYLFSNNLPYLQFDNDYIQIILCDHCFSVGCQSGGYVKEIQIGNLIIWTSTELSESTDEYESSQFEYFNKFGNIIWPIELYTKFLNEFSLSKKSFKIATVFDIARAWKLYISFSLFNDLRKFNSSLISDLIIYNSCNVSVDKLIEIIENYEKEITVLWDLPLNVNSCNIIIDIENHPEVDLYFFDNENYFIPIDKFIRLKLIK